MKQLTIDYLQHINGGSAEEELFIAVASFVASFAFYSFGYCCYICLCFWYNTLHCSLYGDTEESLEILRTVWYMEPPVKM